MIKKLIKQLIPACFLFLGVFTSCTSEGESDFPAALPGISLRLQISAGNTRSSVGTGTEAEKHIDNVHFWFFAEGALDTDKALLYKSETVSSNDDELVLKYTDEVLRLYNMNSEGSYQLFVIANLPADATINGETRLDDLKEYSYTSVNRPGSPFIMTGSSVGVHDFANNSQISIPLLRVASRLDITVKNTTGENWIINKISIAGDQKSVLLFSLASGTASPASNTFGTSLDVMTTPTTNDEVTCSGYINENLSTDAVKVVVEGSVNGTARTWTAELKPDGAAALPRNTICGVTLNLKENTPILPTDVHSTIKEWDTENVTGTIQGTYLHISNKTALVLFPIGGTIGVETNASQIHVDWENAPGFYLSGYPNDTEATVSVSDLSASLDFFLNGNASDVIADGEVVITAGNINTKVTLRKEATSLIYDLKSIKVDGVEAKNRGTVTFFGWGGGVDTYINITMNVNAPWAYKMTVYDKNGDQSATVQNQIVHYSGTPGESSSGNLRMQYDDDVYKNYMPLRVVIELFLTNYNDLGVHMQTFELTVAKP